MKLIKNYNNNFKQVLYKKKNKLNNKYKIT